ncbi:MAG: DUF4006 family protein [Campylobacterales bacterium]|nr:DUF4006 family protein [Campylobacterales bacterium]
MQNTNRGVFALDGVTGMLIATFLLLGILVYLTMMALGAQQANANKFYKIENEKSIQMINKENAAKRVMVN